MSAAGSSASTIRPRTRRLISLNDEEDPAFLDANNHSPWARPTTPSPFPSRGVSPIKSAIPSRSQDTSPKNEAARRQNGFVLGPRSVQPSASSLWGSSWSSIQGLASSLLGNESTQKSRQKPNGSLIASSWKTLSQNPHDSHIPPSQAEWGPAVSSQPQLAVGIKEERRALVQAKKREALLSANRYEIPNMARHFKRRDSNGSSPSRSVDPHDGNGYVYVHRVKPHDTIAGVTIKYDCRPDVFRKVNRFWPNDRIQNRRAVFLPVEACNVRGRKLSDATADLLSSSPLRQPVPDVAAPSHSSVADSPSTPTNESMPQSPSSNLSVRDQEQPWTHSHWVKIDGFLENVQVARMSRRALGFFPPPRRKSGTFSDISRSPSVSLDLGSRLHPEPATNSPAATAAPPPPRHLRPSRHRSSSGSYFASRLQGPGGVGNLRGRSPAQPGPAQDSLNRVLGPHLPNLNPRSSFESVASEHSRVSSTTGLENVGGAVEGWMRKMAGKAATAWADGPSTGWESRKDGTGRWVSTGWGGDLIELDVAESPFVVGEDEDAALSGGGSEETPRVERFSEQRIVSSGSGQGLVSDTSLRGRFPSRSRSRGLEHGERMKDD